MSYKIYLNSEGSAVLNIASYTNIHRDVGYMTLQEQDVLTVSCPAAAESPAYHTLEKKDKKTEKETSRYPQVTEHTERKSINLGYNIIYSWINTSGHPVSNKFNSKNNLCIFAKKTIRDAGYISNR